MEQDKRTRIGSGARADVYREGPYALKIFHKGANPALITREAYIGQLAAEAGLPAPKVYGMAELEEGLAIRMESIAGQTLHEAVAEDPSRCEAFIKELAGLQVQIHRSSVVLPFPLKEWLRERITGNKALGEDVKGRLLCLLETLPEGTALCHGDFHGGNVLTDGTRYTVIDWANACAGHPDADVCRTYLIYALYVPELAGLYLDAYCGQAGRSPEEVLRWLPVQAGARLSEGFGEEREILMSIINEYEKFE